MYAKFEIKEADLKALVFEHLTAKLGKDSSINLENLRIEVKSKQNYKSEWESAAFRAVYEGDI